MRHTGQMSYFFFKTKIIVCTISIALQVTHKIVQETFGYFPGFSGNQNIPVCLPDRNTPSVQA
jgi:hypothetical protein